MNRDSMGSKIMGSKNEDISQDRRYASYDMRKTTLRITYNAKNFRVFG